MLFGFIYDNNKYFYVRDQLQNIIGIVDKAGKLLVQYNYSAYGNNMTISGNTTIGNINPFRYKGYYYDNESGMFYCNSRYYNPLWCRWLNADSVNYLETTDIDGMNLYGYCGNNPVMYIDPSGCFTLFAIITAVVGAFVGAVTTIASEVMTTGKLDWKNVVSGAVGGAVNGFILGVSSGTATSAAGYASAAAESFTREFLDYATGDKKMTSENIMNSALNIAADTLVNGTINYVANDVPSNIKSLKTNKGWIKPKSIISYFTKPYGQKMIKQAVLGGCITTEMNVFMDGIKSFFNI